MGACRRVNDLQSPVGWLSVYWDQLGAQRSATSMGSLYHSSKMGITTAGFTGQIPFLWPNQHCQSTQGTQTTDSNWKKITYWIYIYISVIDLPTDSWEKGQLLSDISTHFTYHSLNSLQSWFSVDTYYTQFVYHWLVVGVLTVLAFLPLVGSGCLL